MTDGRRQHLKDTPTRRPTTPAPLRVGPADDAFEREADRAADAVTRGGLAPWIRALPGDGGVRRKCDACAKEDDETLRRDAAQGDAGGWSAPPIVHDVLRSPGRPLDAPLRAEMERGFGHDFRRVRVHDDAKAAESARAVGAHAYTVGDDIVFASGRYAPADAPGKRLVAHELAHVAQQSATADRGGSLRLQRQTAVMPMLAPPAARATWGQFWRVVARHFALRGATAAGVAAADGPLPVGDLIALGLTLWMIYDLIRLWDQLWREAAQPIPVGPDAQPETRPAPPTTTPAPAGPYAPPITVAPPVPRVDAPPRTDTRPRQTCATAMPGVRLCDSLPPEYTFRSPSAALAEMKRRVGNNSLSLHSPSPTISGPCPGTGTHYNVRAGGSREGSITCCPCCVDSPTGPISQNRCRIVW